jgi:signal transduction histidine kinase/DNA-binding NarL/FixJ family response regulator/HPt (histidine-containing phosphotransfer) domain-containing protein
MNRKSRGQNHLQLFFVFLAFLVMVMASYLLVNIIMRNHLITEAEEVLRTTEANIEASLREPETTITTSAFTVQGMLEKGASQEAILDYITSLTNWVMEHDDRVSGFNGLYGFIRDEWMDGTGWVPPEGYVPQERPWYTGARGKGGAIEATVPYLDADTGEIVISYARELFDKETSFGVLSIDMVLTKLTGYVKNLHIAEGGYGVMLNQNLEIMAYPVDALLNQPLESLNEDCAEIAERLRESGTVSAFRVKHMMNRESSGIVFFKRIFNGWYVGIVTPVQSYYRDVYFTAFILAVLGLVLMLSLMYLLMRLSNAKLRSEEESKSKSSFLARMSHEIRTPMNAIIGMSELILREELTRQAKEYAGGIRQAGVNLLAIINDILDFSKIESGKLDIIDTEYQFGDMINGCIRIIGMRLREKPVALNIDIDPNLPDKLSGDVVRIRQIILNLLSNAIKYTQKGNITLSVKKETPGTETQKGDRIVLVITVSDTGVGIMEEDLPRLFGEFIQFDSKKNYGIEGTGLGLAISRTICRLMGGDITVKSEYGKGSVFTAVIPQKVIDPAPFQYREEEESTGSRFITRDTRILVVDDLETNLNVAKGLLAVYGVEIDTCTGGAEAVKLVQENNYDLVLMDHMMPGMNGIEAAEKIRQWEKQRQTVEPIPIVVLTANAISGMKEMFLERGFSDYLSKPIELAKLDEIIARWVPKEKIIEMEVSSDRSGREAIKDRIDISGIDTQKGIYMTGGSVEGYKEVLFQFCLDMEERFPCFDQASPAADIAIHAHAIKGAAGTIGAEALWKAAAALEIAGKAGEGETIRGDLPGFLALMKETMGHIRKALEEEQGKAETAGREKIRALFAGLKTALENKDMESIDGIIKELKDGNPDAGTKQALLDIEEKMLMSNFREAADAADSF